MADTRATMLDAPQAPYASRREALKAKRFNEDTEASLDIRSAVTTGLFVILGIVVSLIVAFIGAGIVLKTAAGQLPNYLSATKNVTTALSAANVDNGGAADSLLHGISPIAAIVLVVAPLGAVLGIGALFAFKHSRGRGTT